MCFLHRKSDENYQHCTTGTSWNNFLTSVGLHNHHTARGFQKLRCCLGRRHDCDIRLSKLAPASTMHAANPQISQAPYVTICPGSFRSFRSTGPAASSSAFAVLAMNGNDSWKAMVLTLGQVQSLDVFEYSLEDARRNLSGSSTLSQPGSLQDRGQKDTSFACKIAKQKTCEIYPLLNAALESSC